MSRSFKHFPMIKDKSANMKRLANKAVRNSHCIYQNSDYKKVFDSYDISDFVLFPDDETDDTNFGEGTTREYWSK